MKNLPFRSCAHSEGTVFGLNTERVSREDQELFIHFKYYSASKKQSQDFPEKSKVEVIFIDRYGLFVG